MSAPIDQAQRARFIGELERNFSVVASAGSGKTRAITERIIAIATSAHALEWLPALVVVTFTNRAADEMQQRARQSILEAGVSLEVLAAFNRAFFGTIHSFCVRLLRQHGHHLGLPARLDLLVEDDALWMEFVQQHAVVGASLTDAQRRCLLRLAPVRELMELGRHGGVPVCAPTPGDFPAVNFREVLAFIAAGSARRTIPPLQERLRAWEVAWNDGSGFLPLPACTTTAREFVALWEKSVGQIREWLRCASLHVAAEIERAYRAFRLAKDAINYGDQIALAAALLQHPEAARRIREKSYRVILDEAQDTDPAQFAVLLESARPPSAHGAWLEEKTDPPRAGHFCMVGDFQQSIFGERADLTYYQRIHETLLHTGAGEALEFSVTFRLDQQQLDFVNATFAGVLHGLEGQVAFVRLNPRHAVLPGQFVRVDLGTLPDMAGWKDWQRARFEAGQLARWLQAQGLEKLRAEAWREVAVLCPRKAWFAPLREALRCAGFEVQIQSERDLKGDSPAYAWFTALATIMAEPRHGYEIAGVLREVFGLADSELAAFAEGQGMRFQIVEPTQRTGVVAETLELLAAMRARAIALPLYAAMQEIATATKLRDRLLALPAEEFEHLERELTDLLTLAATAEAEGRTLAAFAEELRANFHATREVRPAARDAIQLITAHKAKGSEWQAIVVPFFARGILPRSRCFPRLLRDPRSGETRAVLAAADIDGELKEALDAQSRQEIERLLYVALTRARHTLVIAHDHALFSGKTGLAKHAPARLLSASATAFAAPFVEPSACAATIAEQSGKTRERTREQFVVPLESCPREVAAAARKRATFFIKRNPSALAEAALAEADPAAYLAMTARNAAGENLGSRYGTWWHEFVERLDWRAAPEAHESIFASALESSPDAARSRHEWAQLREQLHAGSSLSRLLTKPGAIVHAELPFLLAINERECLEGIIDLAIFDPGAGAWTILDWKTNRLASGGVAQLQAHYLPQLSAYWHAVTAMVAAPVAAGLYATAAGAWLPYDPAALAAGWENLRRAPATLTQILDER